MGDLPYAVVVDGAGKVSEHKLADHSGGTVLSASVKVVSSTVVNGKRTVVLTHPLHGATTQHYTFDPSQTQMHFINALGVGVDYKLHLLLLLYYVKYRDLVKLSLTTRTMRLRPPR
jgi:hypothetical protein